MMKYENDVDLDPRSHNDLKVFIGGLDYSTTTEQLKSFMEDTYGPVAAARVIFDQERNCSRGFGFVILKDKAQKDKLCGDSPIMIFGARADIRSAQPKGQTDATNSQNGRKLFVGGLEPEITEERLSAYLGKYGEIESCEIMKNDKGPRGFAFVLYKSARDANKSVGKHPELGECCAIRIAVPRSDMNRPEGGRRSPYGEFPGGAASGYPDRRHEQWAAPPREAYGAAPGYGAYDAAGYAAPHYGGGGGYGGGYGGYPAGAYGGYAAERYPRGAYGASPRPGPASYAPPAAPAAAAPYRRPEDQYPPAYGAPPAGAPAARGAADPYNRPPAAVAAPPAYEGYPEAAYGGYAGQPMAGAPRPRY